MIEGPAGLWARARMPDTPVPNVVAPSEAQPTQAWSLLGAKEQSQQLPSWRTSTSIQVELG